ncbi:hypothetical protein KQI82_06180 [Oscillibacter sp. MSJ-2]|uniref:PD-(D/E)XK endonuclease-like domain-containing protein n=1 Tax=Dysosmobacter acutus TaxID=2841504 RepID=A0ABS6F8A8_9FIRM|nr:hypothetical protein [Dysosmobacter acutus]MBU5626506.1 hypothetical protein [Dysosmobacter acutus]
MLAFDEAAHTYTLDGKRLPSVTEVCRFLSCDYQSNRPWLARLAAERGTAIHGACALIDYGEEAEERPELAGYLAAYRLFLKDYRPDWDLIESPIGDAALGLAGTPDRCGTLYDGRRCILDIKTGQLHSAALRAQLTGYARLLRRWRPELAPEVLYGLRLCADGTYELREAAPDEQLLDACLFLHAATERKKKK